jgi:hypothetical protein
MKAKRLSSAVPAKPVELYNVAFYLKAVFFQQPLLCSAKQFGPLMYEIYVIHYATAGGAEQVVMMTLDTSRSSKS